MALSSGAPVAADSLVLVADLVAQYETNYGAVGILGGNFDGYPIVSVPANQPLVPIAIQSGCSNFTPGTGTAIPIPPGANAVLSGTADNPLIVYQPSTATEWEFWQATDTGGSWSACWGGKLTNVGASDGAFADPYGMSGSGISYLGTVITEADVQSGSINHAVAMQVHTCDGSVAPADRTDCGAIPGSVAEGQRLRFPPGLAMPAGLTSFGQMVFRAIQNYGAVVTDRSGGVNLVAEAGADWAYEGHAGTDPITASWGAQNASSALNGMPWSALEVLQP